ncbi:MAG: AAA family ATPase [Desulfovibrio sp.]|uniref:AAA family ATPase n=1 Tax=Desulfovibrio sp. TaxID=885 RepID=UPI0039E2E4C8
MKVSNITFTNFKRFTGLSLVDIPSTARLVLLVGPNGCGKSSVFDGLMRWRDTHKGIGFSPDHEYYRKEHDKPFNDTSNVSVGFHSTPAQDNVKNCIYVRTAYRNTPDFKINVIGTESSPEAHVRRSIDVDTVVNKNYQALISSIFSGIFDPINNNTTVKTFREGFISNLNESLNNVFGDFELVDLNSPIKDGTFFFKKGVVESINYKNLSSGEKSAFDLILDFHLKKVFFTKTVYCVDEIETHIHTSIQGNLLKELLRILPAQSQLWVSTHSLGVVRAAQAHAAANSSEVALFDFSDLNLDEQIVLEPSSLTAASWKKCLSLALDDMSGRIAPEYVVLCEGSSSGTRRKDFDAFIYNKIFGREFPNILFVSGGNCHQVNGVADAVRNALQGILSSAKFISLADRDGKTQQEVDDALRSGTITLGRRHLEAYLFDPSNLILLAEKQGMTDATTFQEIKRKFDAAIKNSISRGNPHDDFKSASGTIYNELKQILNLNRHGNNTDEFCKHTLSGTVEQDTNIYNELKNDVIDKIFSYAK